MTPGQNKNVIDYAEGLMLLTEALHFGHMENIPTSVIHILLAPLCSIYGIPLAEVGKSSQNAVLCTSLLDLAERRGQPEFVKFLMKEKVDPLLQITKLPLGSAYVHPVMANGLKDILSQTETKTETKAAATQQFTNADEISWDKHIKATPKEPSNFNPIHKQYALQLLGHMLLVAKNSNCSFKTIFHFLATSCVQHNFTLDQIRTPNPAGLKPLTSLRGVMLERMDNGAVQVIDMARQKHPNLVINDVIPSLPVSMSDSPRLQTPMSLSSNSNSNPVPIEPVSKDQKTAHSSFQRPLFSRPDRRTTKREEGAALLVNNANNGSAVPSIRFAPVRTERADFSALASLFSDRGSQSSDSRNSPFSGSSGSFDSNSSVSVTSSANSSTPSPGLRRDSSFDSPVKLFTPMDTGSESKSKSSNQDRGSATPSKLEIGNLSLTPPPVKRTVYFFTARSDSYSPPPSPSLVLQGDPICGETHQKKLQTQGRLSKVEEKMMDWSSLSHEEIMTKLNAYVSESRGNSEARGNCPFNADHAVQFLSTGIMPKVKPITRPNKVDYFVTTAYVDEVIIKGKVVRVRQAIESTVTLRENAKIVILPPGCEKGERACYEKRIEYFKLQEQLIQEAKDNGGTVWGRMDFHGAGKNPGTHHTVAFLATRVIVDTIWGIKIMYKVYVIDPQLIMGGKLKVPGNEGVFSDPGKVYCFVDENGSFKEGYLGTYCFYYIDSPPMPRLQLENMAEVVPMDQSTSLSNSQSSSHNAMTPVAKM